MPQGSRVASPAPLTRSGLAERALRRPRRIGVSGGTRSPPLDMSTSPRLPDARRATCVGGAGGFLYRYGSDWTNAEAAVDGEEFTETIAITADFPDRTVRGCIGCVGDLVLEREHLYGALGFRRLPPPAPPTDDELHSGLR